MERRQHREDAGWRSQEPSRPERRQRLRLLRDGSIRRGPIVSQPSSSDFRPLPSVISLPSTALVVCPPPPVTLPPCYLSLRRQSSAIRLPVLRAFAPLREPSGSAPISVHQRFPFSSVQSSYSAFLPFVPFCRPSSLVCPPLAVLCASVSDSVLISVHQWFHFSSVQSWFPLRCRLAFCEPLEPLATAWPPPRNAPATAAEPAFP